MIDFEELYKYVQENIGTGNIEFNTRVGRDEFKKYINNYPGNVTSNCFMGYEDFYCFDTQTKPSSHYDFMIGRHYIDYGADDYYLPTIIH